MLVSATLPAACNTRLVMFQLYQPRRYLTLQCCMQLVSMRLSVLLQLLHQLLHKLAEDQADVLPRAAVLQQCSSSAKPCPIAASACYWRQTNPFFYYEALNTR
jgi:hypothetical protein